MQISAERWVCAVSVSLYVQIFYCIVSYAWLQITSIFMRHKSGKYNKFAVTVQVLKLNKKQNPFLAGILPQTPLGSLQCSPDL